MQLSDLTCLTFAKEVDAITGEKKIWIHYVTQAANQDLRLLRLNDQPIPSLAAFNALTEDEKYNCEILGNIKGLIVKNGHTVSFAAVLKIYQEEKWWIKKPDNPDFLVDVIGYVEETFNSDWLGPV